MMAAAVLLVGTILVIFQKSSDPAGSRSRSRQAHSDSDVTGNDDPSQPVPRTKEEVDWWKRHDVLVERVESSDAIILPTSTGNDPNENGLPQLVFLGDSITEGWEGTSFGKIPRPHRNWKKNEDQEIRNIFESHFVKGRWSRAAKPPLTLGISGDQTQHVIWRLQHGEFPSSSSRNHPIMAVVLIGTNNLGNGMLPEPTLEGIETVCRTILKQGVEHVWLSDVLPRYDTFRVQRLCPPRCHKDGTPFSSFMPAIDRVNAALPKLVDRLNMEFPSSHIAISACGHIFRPQNDTIMPDQLHPNANGYRLWANCLSEHLTNHLKTTSSSPPQ
uniref:SGNH hydrolase-type esterase domain-containing protein n=1 Tax=Attheya septentrionalis TaxID=420275 RepID=A0A7S2UL84_9STRA